MKTRTQTLARSAGFTLVEIMIGLLIGLIGIVVIMETFAVSEGYRRTATSGGDAQTNGAIAMYLMQRELRDAGYNMQPFLVAGCTSVVVWNNNLGKSTLLRWVPVDINPVGFPAGDPNTDVILIAYGAADSFVGGMSTFQAAASVDPFQLAKNVTGIRTGDMVVSVMPSLIGGPPSCVMHEVTNVANPNGNCGQGNPAGSGLNGGPNVEHKVVSYKNFYNGCQIAQPIRNSGSGILDQNGVPVPAVGSPQGLLFNFGPTPAAKIYAIRNGNLTMCSAPTTDCTIAANYDVVVNDIVSMRAILGGDYAATLGAPINPVSGIINDGVLDQWSRNPINSAGDARKTMAVALELTARSNLREKSSTGNPDPTACDTTVNPNRPDKGQTTDWYAQFVPLAAGSLGGAQIDLSQVDPQWQCYRYKLFTSIVTLRNMLWTPG